VIGAYGRGEIELEPIPEKDPHSKRYRAVSTRVETEYTITTIARFTGWTRRRDEPTPRFRRAFDAWHFGPEAKERQQEGRKLGGEVFAGRLAATSGVKPTSSGEASELAGKAFGVARRRSGRCSRQKSQSGPGEYRGGKRPCPNLDMVKRSRLLPYLRLPMLPKH
jgi:hypothetical protein